MFLRSCAFDLTWPRFALCLASSVFTVIKPCVCCVQDNLSVFLRGCEELGLKGSQLFDPGDLQDTSTRPTAK